MIKTTQVVFFYPYFTINPINEIKFCYNNVKGYSKWRWYDVIDKN